MSPICDHVWHYYFAIEGQRYRGSTNTTVKALAKEIEARARAEALAVIAPPVPARALPEHVKAVGPDDRGVDPLSESSAAVWNRWSRDREIRQAVEHRTVELTNREIATRAIYPRECAARLAEELKTVAPDWRFARPTLGPAWGQLLKQQPELAPELTKRREAIITTLLNHTPPEFHRAIHDLRKLIDLRLEAHEAAAFYVGWETRAVVQGREQPPDARRAFPRGQPSTATTLRLTFG